MKFSKKSIIDILAFSGLALIVNGYNVYCGIGNVSFLSLITTSALAVVVLSSVLKLCVKKFPNCTYGIIITVSFIVGLISMFVENLISVIVAISNHGSILGIFFDLLAIAAILPLLILYVLLIKNAKLLTKDKEHDDMNNGSNYIERTIRTYPLKDGFYVDVEQSIKDLEFIDFYLYHKDYGVKNYIVGLQKEAITDIKKTIDLLIEDYDSINCYKEEYFDLDIEE